MAADEGMDFRTALNETLRRFGIKAAALSEACGISPMEISRFRKGRKDVNAATLKRMVDALPNDARLYFYYLLMAYPGSSEGLNDD
jgi:transcriptional regulator with XRE-family HTH domain